MSSGVEFEEDTFGRTHRPAAPQQVSTPGYASFGASVNPNDPKMVQWLMRKGFVKTPGAAQGMLIAIIIINVVITYSIISYVIL